MTAITMAGLAFAVILTQDNASDFQIDAFEDLQSRMNYRLGRLVPLYRVKGSIDMSSNDAGAGDDHNGC